MRYINKGGGGGTAWDQFATTTGARFDNAPTDAKNSLRRTLARQQGYLCAFCQVPLSYEEETVGNVVPKTKIAHLTSQAAPAGSSLVEISRRERLEVDQHNLVLACMGTSSPKGHCDEKQKSRDVSIRFENANMMSASFQYPKNGRLTTSSAEYRAQIGDDKEEDDKASVLNLNNPTLCRARRRAVDDIAYALEMRGDYSLQNLQAKLALYTEADSVTGRRQAYCEWMAAFLRLKINRATQNPTSTSQTSLTHKSVNPRRR
jgi:uncharacterized protein (TIGR02646 family)